MNRYITRGIANNLPITLQHQLWELVSEREQNNQRQGIIGLFSYIPIKYAHNQLYIKHKQERPEYVKTHKANYSKATI